VEVVVGSFMAAKPADKAVDMFFKLKAAGEHEIDAVPANAAILSKL
jgi:hypothetical protein